MGAAAAGTRPRVLVTGAGGFIGGHVCPALAQAGFDVVRAPGHGDVVVNPDGTVTYTPAAGFSGTDSFTYEVGDGNGNSDTAVVSVEVAADDPGDPSQSEGIYKLSGSRTFASASDVIVVDHSSAFETSAATIELAFNANTVAGTQGILSKDASHYEGGGHHFTAYLSDGNLHVRFQNDEMSKEKVVRGIEANRDYDLAVTFGEGRAAVYLDGELQGDTPFDMNWENNTQYMQIGATGWRSASGDDDFENVFQGTISDVRIVEGVQAIASRDEGTPPQATDDAVTVDAGGTVAFDPLANDTDPDGTALSLASVGEAANGTVTLNADGTVSYSPDAAFSGSDSFEYTVEDASGATDTGLVTIDVTAAALPSDTLYSLAGPLEVNGADDVVVVDHSAAMEVGAGSIAFTFNADSVSSRQGLLSKDASHYVGGGHHFSAWIEDGSLHVRFQDEESSETIKADGIEAGRNHEVLATFGDGEVALWLDDQLVGSSDFTMNWQDNVQQLQLGALGWASKSGASDFVEVFSGTIADVAILDTVVSPVDLDLIV